MRKNVFHQNQWSVNFLRFSSFLSEFTLMPQAFPEALFLQLLLTMVCPDYETRVGAHRVFSIVLVPSSVCLRPSATTPYSAQATNIQRTVSRTVSVFSSSAALFEKISKDRDSSQENACHERKDEITSGENANINNQSILNRLKSTYSRAYSVKRHSLSLAEETSVSNLQRPVCINTTAFGIL